MKKAAKYGLYTTFVGIGLDFNPDLCETITKVTNIRNFAEISSVKDLTMFLSLALKNSRNDLILTLTI